MGDSLYVEHLTEAVAKVIYEGVCQEGIEECHYGTPWGELPEATRGMYRNVAVAVLRVVR